MVPRSLADVARFYDGLEMVEPGLVPLNEWRPGDADLPVLPNIGGVGRKP
jgi:hypothetical protein